jgi:hypothetical protein
MTNVVNKKPARPGVKKKSPLKPVCIECSNAERFEIDESDWNLDGRGNQVLIEKIRCLACGAFLKATYRLVQWEAWKNE